MPLRRSPARTGTLRPKPDKGRYGPPMARPSRPRPWQAVAVADTAGLRWVRHRHGCVTGVRRAWDGRVTEASRLSWGVTETSGTPRFLPCCPTLTDALHGLTVP
jgi:hypothetical protein